MKFTDALTWLYENPGRRIIYALCELSFQGGRLCERARDDVHGKWKPVAPIRALMDADWQIVPLEPFRDPLTEYVKAANAINNNPPAGPTVKIGGVRRVPFSWAECGKDQGPSWTITPSALGAKDKPAGDGISQNKARKQAPQDLVARVLANPGGYPRSTRSLAKRLADAEKVIDQVQHMLMNDFSGPIHFGPIDAYRAKWPKETP